MGKAVVSGWNSQPPEAGLKSRVATMKTLLYVEDSPDDRFLVERACGMGQVSFLLKTVESGFEAIRYLSGEEEFGDRAENPIPELILLDLQMREADGFEVLRWIRGDPTTRAIPVALYTGSFIAEDIAKANHDELGTRPGLEAAAHDFRKTLGRAHHVRRVHPLVG